MLRAFCVLFVVAVAWIPTPSGAQVWAEYRPEGAGYSVEMPGEWTITVEDIKTAIGNVKGYTATVDVGTRAYMSMYIPYPPEKIIGKPVTPILDGARDGAVSNVNGKLRSEERVIVSNLPARQIIIDAPPQIVLVLRYFLIENMLVQALAAGPQGVELEPSTKRFLGSLKVVKK